MIEYSTYCTAKALSKKEQKVLFKEIVDCKKKIAKKKNIKAEKRISEIHNKIVCSYIPLVIQAELDFVQDKTDHIVHLN